MAIIAFPVDDHASVFVNGQETAMSRDAQSPLERVSEDIESDTTPASRSPMRFSKRPFRKLRTVDLMNKLDERDKEVQQLLLAGEAAIQSNLESCTDPAHPSLEEESPVGFQWDVPDFPELPDIAAKRDLSEDIVDIVDSSPGKRARSQYEEISESARGLASMMAGMSQRIAQLSDPKYLDDLLALSPSLSQSEDSINKPEVDEWYMSEVERLREENRKLHEELAESKREKAEMSKVLFLLEDRLTKCNGYLRVLKSNETSRESERVKSTLRRVSLRAPQLSKAVMEQHGARFKQPQAVIKGR